MFLDSELRDIAEAKAALVTRCDLRRQMLKLEASAALSGLRRRVTLISLGLGLGLHVFELVSLWRARRAGRG